jgi:hypothetical protein
MTPPSERTPDGSPARAEVLHVIRNQLALISGQSTLLEMHQSLDAEAKALCRDITDAVFVISRALAELESSHALNPDQ